MRLLFRIKEKKCQYTFKNEEAHEERDDRSVQHVL